MARSSTSGGEPLAAAIVSGGENYTHTNEDGSFWLDNVAPGPFPVWVGHHEYRSLVVPDVASQTDDLRIQLAEPLPRLRLHVLGGEAAEDVPVLAVEWTWPKGEQPLTVPISPNWHSASGRYEIPIPERALAAIISAPSYAVQMIDLGTLEDGEHEIHLRAPEAPVESEPSPDD